MKGNCCIWKTVLINPVYCVPLIMNLIIKSSLGNISITGRTLYQMSFMFDFHITLYKRMWYGGPINIYVLSILYSRESLLDGYYWHATPVFMSEL